MNIVKTHNKTFKTTYITSIIQIIISLCGLLYINPSLTFSSTELTEKWEANKRGLDFDNLAQPRFWEQITDTGYGNFALLTVYNPQELDQMVYYKTIDGTAIAGKDYIARSGSLYLDPRGTISIKTIWQNEPKADTKFYIQLTDRDGNALTDGNGNYIVSTVIIRYSKLTATLTVKGASSVCISGPTWGYNPNCGPVATNNGDGTWTVVFNPLPASTIIYAWLIDGAEENLVPLLEAGYCSAEIRAGTIVSDYESYSYRKWTVGSGNIADTAGACLDDSA